MTTPASPGAASALTMWLDAHAEALDAEQALAAQVLPRLGLAGVLRIGVPAQLGGSGGDTGDAIEAIADIASHSLTAAFVFWGQRTFIEYLLRSSNTNLRQRWLQHLLAGDFAGASGLSNAVKYLSQLEALQVRATGLGAAQSTAPWTLNGSLPWITNLRREGFLAALAVDHVGGRAAIFAIPHSAPGVARSDDLDLIALRASNTAALSITGVVLDGGWVLAEDASGFLASVRPAFLGLQCGLSIGLARRALSVIDAARGSTRAVVAEDAAALGHELAGLTRRLRDGVTQGAFLAAPDTLFDVRIALARVVDIALRLEVQVAGGSGYLRGRGGTARRAREAAFIPIVTPSVVQLKAELARQRRTRAA